MNSDSGFDMLKVGFGVVFGAAFATIDFGSAYLVGTIFLIGGISIITYTWPRKGRSHIEKVKEGKA